MAYIYICNYNNYFNRRVKKIDTFGGYSNFAIYTESGNDVNFNPGDGVVTQSTAGRQSNSYSGIGDYLVFSMDGETVQSRWFIIDATRTRNGQYNLNLKRDVVADNLDVVINSPMFIEKATVGSDSPFIYNKENFTCNQIKQDEKLLLYKGFLEEYEEFDYKPRGNKPMVKEDIYTRVARLCSNTKSRQDKMRDKAFTELTELIETKNKLKLDDEIETTDLVPNPILIRNKNNIDIATEKALHNLILGRLLL